MCILYRYILENVATSGTRFLTAVGLGLDTVRRKEYNIVYYDRFIVVVRSLMSKSRDLTIFIFAMCTIPVYTYTVYLYIYKCLCTRILHGPFDIVGGAEWGWQLIFYCSSFLRGVGGRRGSRLFMIFYTCVIYNIYIHFISRPVVAAKDINQSEDIFDRASAAATADQRRSSSSSQPRRMAIKIINYINNARSHPNCITHTHTRIQHTIFWCQTDST